MEDTQSEQTKERTKPPVGAVQWFADFFKLLERIRIDKVDNALLTTNNVVPSASEYKVMGGLRFLDLIKEDGTATERMKSLSVVGAEYQKNFEKMVRDAYTILFGKVKDLEQAIPDDVINCLRTNYGMAPSTAKQGAQIFVFLAQKAGIPLSQTIIEKLSVSPEKAKAIGKTPRKAKQARQRAKSVEEGAQEQLPTEALARFTLKGTGYVDIKDKDTLGIAKAYLKILSKKLGIDEEESK
jgi:hypothetical protein